MKQRFILFRRGDVYYCEDSSTGKQSSLKTRNKAEALTLLNARNEAHRQPQLNVEIARTYLAAGDAALNTRTWQAVMDQMQTHGKASTQQRCSRAMESAFYSPIRNKPLVQTCSQDLLTLLRTAKVSEAHYLRRLHNLAVGLGWLPMPVLAPRLWPKVEWREKRGKDLRRSASKVQ